MISWYLCTYKIQTVPLITQPIETNVPILSTRKRRMRRNEPISMRLLHIQNHWQNSDNIHIHYRTIRLLGTGVVVVVVDAVAAFVVILGCRCHVTIQYTQHLAYECDADGTDKSVFNRWSKWWDTLTFFLTFELF